ncbi:hypothetical protein HBB16_19810 [Pseudonocardia sp. MCCB 268]|nr:hypothetical protein [Pseudonocardia cytotoxica]
MLHRPESRPRAPAGCALGVPHGVTSYPASARDGLQPGGHRRPAGATGAGAGSRDPQHGRRAGGQAAVGSLRALLVRIGGADAAFSDVGVERRHFAALVGDARRHDRGRAARSPPTTCRRSWRQPSEPPR